MHRDQEQLRSDQITPRKINSKKVLDRTNPCVYTTYGWLGRRPENRRSEMVGYFFVVCRLDWAVNAVINNLICIL